MNFEPQYIIHKNTLPVFTSESEELIRVLQQMTASDIKSLMGVSDKLAIMNYQRYQTWENSPELPKSAIFAFDGDVYDGLNAKTLNGDDIFFAQQSVRILSGLYGVLSPLDLIRPHRLEMGTDLKVNGHKNLYAFWGDQIVRYFNQVIQDSHCKILVNLASQEYFKSINPKKLDAKVITADFRDLSNGSYRIVSFYAKRARGLMTRFIIRNRITDPEEMKAFDSEGYRFSPAMSTDSKLVFLREH